MDYKKYAPDWKDVIRPSILKRDNYKCCVCSVEHRSRVYKNTNGGYITCDDFTELWAVSNGKKVFTLYLQVAHLDHNKSNNEPVNLRSLCPFHHARYDANHKKFSRVTYLAKIKPIKSLPDQLELSERHVLKLNVKQWIKEKTGTNIPFVEIEELFKIIKF
jgi:hypothetical protein